MGQPRFVHLHLHTDYSLLDGACEISELVNEAARRGMPAVAVTDHGNLFAAANFCHEAITRGVKPLIGCEVYVARGSRHDRGAATAEPMPAGRGSAEPRCAPLCPSPAGERTICCSSFLPASSKASTTSRALTMNCWPSTAAA